MKEKHIKKIENAMKDLAEELKTDVVIVAAERDRVRIHMTAAVRGGYDVLLQIMTSAFFKEFCTVAIQNGLKKEEVQEALYEHYEMMNKVLDEKWDEITKD